MIHPRYEQVRGVELNALLFSQQRAERDNDDRYLPSLLVKRIHDKSGGYANCVRMFHWLAQSWLPVDYHVGLHAKPVIKKNGTTNPDLHPPMVQLLHAIVGIAAQNNMWILIDVSNRSSATASGIHHDVYHGDRFLKESHFPYIDNFVSEFKRHPNILYETCNESMGSKATLDWERKMAGRIKKAGGRLVVSSSINAGTRHATIFNPLFDFTCLHGLWTQHGLRNYVFYREHGTKVWFSGDGHSELKGGKASKWLQWDKEKYGYLPSPKYHKELIRHCAARNNGIWHNLSGGVEGNPKWAYFDQCLKEYNNAFRL